MKLSVKGEYAIRALQVLGEAPAADWVRIPAVASQQNIPRKFLEQILSELRSAGLVESRRGVHGGYRLARPADRISLAEIVREVDGALAPVSCVSARYYEPCSCPDETRCALRSVMKEVRDSVVAQMEKSSVADLCQRAAWLKQHPQSSDFVI